MSERIIREGIEKLGLTPGDPDYIQLVTLIRNIVTDVKLGRTTLGDVERFLDDSRDALETLIESKKLNVTVDDAVKILLDVVKTAVFVTGSSLLDMYTKFTRGSRYGKKREEELKEEEKTSRII